MNQYTTTVSLQSIHGTAYQTQLLDGSDNNLSLGWWVTNYPQQEWGVRYVIEANSEDDAIKRLRTISSSLPQEATRPKP